MFAGRRELLLCAGCGAVAGASVSWPGGWIAVQLALAVLVVRLASVDTGPSRAGLLFAAFVACFYGVGLFGLTAAVAGSLRPWTLGVLAFIACIHALVAGLSCDAVFRIARSLALDRRLTLLLAMPVLWAGREWLSAHVDASVPWLVLGAAQAPDGPLAALLPVGGVLLASFASVAISVALALAWRREGMRPRLHAAGGVLACVAVVMACGSLQWTSPSSRSLVELVQSGPTGPAPSGNAAVERALQFYADTVRSSDAALIVAPQLAIAKIPDALPDGYLRALDARLRARNADALLGMYFAGDATNAYFNGVLSIGASGEQRYLKHHLFPFGEYIPLPARMAAWVNSSFVPPRVDGAAAPLSEAALLGGGLRVALAVCYEAAFGDSLRPQAASADLIVAPSSDGTHDSLQLASQTRQIIQARALEFQKPVVRTSDVRGTYFVDASGHVTGELPAGVPGTMTQSVQGYSGLTPYARWGDALALGVAGSSLSVFLLLAVRSRSARRGHEARRPQGPAIVTAALRQRGQVLPAAIALLVIIAGFFYLMVNAGQTVTEKMRVTNAADAAAYSAAVVEARALNYDAYLNRAMVANQMAIAQMVSFASWLDYFARSADHFGEYVSDMNYYLLPNPKVAVLDVAFGGSAVVAAYFGGQTVKEYTDEIIDYGAGPIISVYDVATTALSVEQIAVQVNLTAGVRQGQVANDIVKAMDPKLNAEVVLVSHGFDLFTKNYSGDERSRFADVAVRSRDPFTKERNFTLDSFDIPFVRKDGALKKRGGTDLIGLDEWRGVDTLELHGEHFFCGRFGLSWCDDVKQPIGWGAIEVDAGGGDAGHGYHGNAYGENPTTAKNADDDMRSPQYSFYSGIPRSQEIKDVKPEDVQTTSITVLVSKAQADTLTSGNAAQNQPSGSLAVFDSHPAGGKLMALSRAQVFFDRISARADGKSELGSLYNPYWRVRLISPTLADRAYAAAKQGGLLLPDIP